MLSLKLDAFQSAECTSDGAGSAVDGVRAIHPFYSSRVSLACYGSDLCRREQKLKRRMGIQPIMKSHFILVCHRDSDWVVEMIQPL